MKILLPFTLAIGLIASLPAIPAAQPPVNRVLASMVDVRAVDAKGEGSFCAGFVINAGGWVATADHCIPEGGSFTVDGQPSKVLKTDGWIAIVTYEAGRKPPLTLATSNPGLFEKVWSFGNGFDWGMIVLERKVAGYYSPPAIDHKDIVVNAPLAPGMSGGPIVNSRGEVVGINQLATNATGVGCEVKAIRNLMRSTKD